jgi:hypothetical protein
MQPLAIELVDAGVTSVDCRGRISSPSPGLAIVDQSELAVGDDAASRARLAPRRLHSRFWQDLGTEPLTRPFPNHLRTADLAHAHLIGVWHDSGAEWDQVLLAVPGVMSASQLGLLLGLAQASSIPVSGLVDLAVAAAANRAIREQCLHLDLHLHRAVLTVLQHDSDVRRQQVVTEDRVGLSSLMDAWARAVAGKFVRTTRFDPLLSAATEQVLYLHLPAHLRSLCDQDVIEIAIASGGRRHSIDFERHEAVTAASGYTVLVDAVRSRTAGREATVLLSDRAASLPGLVSALAEVNGLEIMALHPAAAASAALDHASHLLSSGPEFKLVTSLPGFDGRPPGAATVAVDSRDA